MPCYSPLSAWRTFSQAKGKKIVWGRDHLSGYDSHKPLQVPCGQCIGCRLERSRQWAARIMAEAQCHEKTSFLTLTYKEMPANGSLNSEDFTLFMKRLRRHFEPRTLRYFQCGEYGERHGRPHHHCILFGEDFGGDRSPIEDSQSGFPQYESKTLDDIWGHGRCTLGDVTFESAAYVARYSLKKVTGVSAQAHYAGRKPEYVTMSRRPGIGALWFAKYGRNVYPGDFFVPAPHRPATLPPKYFDKLLERSDPELFARVKADRRKAEREALEKIAQIHGLNMFEAGFLDTFEIDPDNRPSRLSVREEVKERTLKTTLKRGIE